MQIKIWYRPASPRASVTIHAWDQNGQVWDVPGTLQPDGITFAFSLSGNTQDQRDVSFRYRFSGNQWENSAWIRTVPTTDATELWTQDFSARCATEAPGGPATFTAVTVHAITRQRFNGGAVYAWPQTTPPGPLYYQAQRDDTTQTSSFVIPLTNAWTAGFYFKLVGHGSDMRFGDFEADSANRFWQPSDGADVWVKSGEPDVQSQPLVPVTTNVDFVFPQAFGSPNLRIQDVAGDFDDTLNVPAPTPIDAIFSTGRYAVTVYTGALYQIWWSIESRGLARRFRIPLGGTTDPSIAVNGYDHWLPAPPIRTGAIDLVIHPNPSTAFGGTIPVQVGVAAALTHETVTAARSPDGTWLAQLRTFPGVPFWAALVGESRVDGPLDFRRGIMSGAQPITLHTVDAIGGATIEPPAAFLDPDAGLRLSLMKEVYGSAIVDAGVFDSWEMPHGANKLGNRAFFVVRAPHAMRCSVLLMAAANPVGTPRAVTTVPMSLTRDMRYWWVSVPAAEAPHGMLYRFAYSDGRELLAPSAKFGEALDPACRWALDKGSLTVDAGSGADQSWSIIADLIVLGQPMQGSAWQQAGWNWLLIYEMHAQRFTQRNAAATSDFDQVVRELQGGYLTRLPVTALEFLPLHEFPDNQAGWGYNPSLFFAIESSYGGPLAFAQLVRGAHDAGRGIVADLVYNHLVDSPLQAIARDVYVSGATQWGDMVYFAHPAACEFFRQATVHLWNFFRLDGFRFDSTETIINGGTVVASTPYVIATGPDGNYLLGAGEGWEFLGMLHSALHRAADAAGRGWPYLVGENDPENPPMTDPSFGVLDGQWHFSEMYALNNAAQNGDDHSSDVRGGLDASGQPFQRSVIYGESHDSASGQGWTKRIAATEKWGNGRQMSKAVGTLALLAEGIPMIFMGEEAAEDQPFTFGNDPTMLGFTLRLDSYEAPSEFLQVLTWFRDLMGLRNNPTNGLQGNDIQSTGQGYKTVAFSRASGQFFVVITFGTSNQQQNLAWLGLPGGASYKEIFNSTWPQYQVHAEALVTNGGYSAQLHSGDLINLPTIGAIVLQRN
jgi:1,4-alpha-glucan branching enzyme